MISAIENPADLRNSISAFVMIRSHPFSEDGKSGRIIVYRGRELFEGFIDHPKERAASDDGESIGSDCRQYCLNSVHIIPSPPVVNNQEWSPSRADRARARRFRRLVYGQGSPSNISIAFSHKVVNSLLKNAIKIRREFIIHYLLRMHCKKAAGVV